MASSMPALGAALFALLAGLSAVPGAHTSGQAPPEPGFSVYHYDSVVVGTEFREVFRVHETHGAALPLANVTILLDGTPIGDAAWADQDGTVTVGDRVSFVREAFDAQQVLSAQANGREVMSCRFGAGAGRPVEPDVARSQGLLRCLDPVAGGEDAAD